MMLLSARAPRVAVRVAAARAMSLELDGAARVPGAETLRPPGVRLPNREVGGLSRGGHLPFVPRELRTNQPAVGRSFFDRLGLVAVALLGKIEQLVELRDVTLGSRDRLRLERRQANRGLFDRHDRIRQRIRNHFLGCDRGEHLRVESRLLRFSALARKSGVARNASRPMACAIGRSIVATETCSVSRMEKQKSLWDR